MSSENLSVRATESYYDDLIGLQLMVPRCTWDKEEAEECWGENYASKFARGVIKKVSLHRKSKAPRFEIHFPEKPHQNSFVGFDLDYIMSFF